MKTVFIEVEASKKSIAMRRKVFGVGVNDAKYQLSHTSKGKRINCPYYLRWKGMLERCYSLAFKEKFKSYDDCHVCDDWLIFSKFKLWMENQDWQCKHLDKDLIITGNKEYSPLACSFIDEQTNRFLINTVSPDSSLRMGVHYYLRSGKFLSSCSNPFTKKREHLGYFDSEDDAHKAWLSRKNELSISLAKQQTDERAKHSLLTKYNKDL